ncbi:MAG: DUF992 domain-containing protein [Pseudomonadota bacterium]
MSRILAFTALAATVLTGIGVLGTPASAQPRIEAGVLECKGRGGWGQILVSRKEFLCNFTSISGKQLGRYRAVVTKYGLDIGVTSNATVVWGVFAPADLGGPNYVVGSLDGDYVGVGAKASVGVGLGANALVGGGARSFALQPVSVESQTGLNLAVGVQQLSLTFIEKL